MIKIGTIKVLGSALYQWELGRKVQIYLAPNMRVAAVQFAHMGDAEALNVEPREENGIIVADIPNILLQSGQKIAVFLVDVNENKVETTTHAVLPVIPRPRPTDYVYTETEVLSWQALEARVIKFMDEINEARVSGDLKGAPGADGFSPTVQVQTITGGHKVTVTDKDGPKSFDVMDGKDGAAGGVSGEGIEEVFVVNAMEDDGFSPPRYSADKTSQEIYEAWMADKIIVCKYLMSGFPVELQPLLITYDTVIFSALAILHYPNYPNYIDLNMYTSLVIQGEKVYVQYTEVESGGATPEQIEEAVNKYLDENPIEGGVSFETNETLSLKDGILSVNTTDQMEQDNTLPITSAGVYATVGNIEALLKTI